jgi:beta-galactosidase
VSDASAENLNQYVHNGGNLVMSFFSGIVDENEHVRLGGYPAPFREMLGLVVEEYVPYSETQSNAVCLADGRQHRCSFWADVIHLGTAQALATFAGEYYAGQPAVTRNRFGKGTAFYVGTLLDRSGLDWLIDQVCATGGILPVAPHVPAGVEVVRRVNGRQSWLFVLNHRDEAVTISLDQPGRDVLNGRELGPSLRLDPLGIAVIQLLNHG